ncbi:helix-turn-helix transcriptional regulator [Leucothrix mucor]|uniref:helix-turn-helix transcriptional regulator n=1 Tax=Leucothrix mucor TaxID=45248 RepID=UPI0003B45925|nr:transcriptional regulator [Leucothrix mucor]
MMNTTVQVKPFAAEGKVRVKEAAPFLGIAVSTFWLYVKQGRIQEPMRYGARVSVWDAEYIRELANNGIPAVEEV